MPDVHSIANQDSNRANITFITLLRAIASLLVVWCHLVSGWTIHHQVTFGPLLLSRSWLTLPLAVMEDFGFLGVAIFFYVSGFIITHVAQRESQFAFFVKRVFRIYPPLIVSTIVVAALVKWCPNPLDQSGELTGRTISDFLRGMTLMNYFSLQDRYINGVAWTLIIEVIFYALCMLVLPVMRWSAWAATLLLTGFSWVVLFRCHDFGDRFANFSVSMGLIPLLLIGQSTYWLWIGRIKSWQFGLLLAANWFVFANAIGTIYIQRLSPSDSYGVSALYAYLLFIVTLLANNRLRLPRVIVFYSTISYSLYLLHIPIGEALLTFLAPRIGYAWAIVPVFGAVTLASYLSWRLVEQPTQTAARRLLGFCKTSWSVAAVHRGYAMAVVAVMISLSVALLAINPKERTPLGDFLMPIPSPEVASAADAPAPDPLPAPTAPPLPAAAAPPPPATGPTSTTQPCTTSEYAEGSFDAAEDNMLLGWAYDVQQPNTALVVEYYIDGFLVGSAVADRYREDLATGGKGDGNHGFAIAFPALLCDGRSHKVTIKIGGTDKELWPGSRSVTAQGGR
jgi:peptidoglycan/LPS O-acetylase OafA/YrhL